MKDTKGVIHVGVLTCLALATVCPAVTVEIVGAEGKPVRLSGRVVDSKSQPVAGAEVVAIEKCRDNYYRGPTECAEVLTAVKRTDSEGRFLLNANSTSHYYTYVVVRKEGFALGWDALTYNWNDKAEGNFNIILEKPNTLAGKVVDEEGAPVAATVIQAAPKTSYLRRLEQRPIYAPEEWFTTKTSSKGDFAFKNFSIDTSADFWVQVRGRDLVYHYTTHFMEGRGFKVGREDLKLVIPRGATIQGKVVEQRSGVGISGVRLLLQMKDSRNVEQQRYRSHEVVSGPDGVFSIRGVPEGEHILRVVTPSDRTAEWIGRTVVINVAADEDLKNVTVRVEKGAMLEVTARDRTTRRSVSGIKMFVRKMRADRSTGFFRIADTGPDGIAHIRVPTGRWNVNVSRGGDYVYIGPREGIQATAIRSRPSRVEVMLEPKPRIRGTVLEGSRRPVRPAVVSIYPEGDRVFTDSLGRFDAKTSDYPMTVVARDVGRNMVGLTDVRNTSGAVKVRLKPAVPILGVITDTNGKGIPAARVKIVTFTSDDRTAGSGYDEVITDSKGHYKIDALAPQKEGFHYLEVSVFATGYGQAKWKKFSVKAGAGEVVHIPTIKLTPADSSISGVVVDKHGKPSANIPMGISGTDGFDQPSRGAVTDSQGRFVINILCRGPLKVWADFANSPTGCGALYAYGGDEDVKVVIGERRTHTAGASLVGKHLPDLTGFEIEPRIEQTAGERMLICFFDINERPSRYCVVQLNRRAGQLRKQGVLVVCVQAGLPLTKEHINDLRAEDRLSLPIGSFYVRNECVKTRRQWAVQVMPWLILTDEDHIVVAEGFELNELDDKIRGGM